MSEQKNNSVSNDFFQKLENTRPFLKMAFEGFAGTGKTFTSAQTAIGLHKLIQSKKPIVWYDTEKALKALKPFFDKQKIQVLTRESRSLADLTKTIELCEGGVSDILVIDSITHVWESFMESYRQEKRRTFLQMLDWTVLKPKWKKEFSDKLVQSKLHIIFTGRAGFEYGMQENETTGKDEMVKTGIKMKVEGETEYEPDIVILMEKIKTINAKNGMSIMRQAQVIKDRTTLIDGKLFTNPKFSDFKPAISILLNGESKENNMTETKDSFASEDEIEKNKLNRTILLQEIESVMVSLFPGQSAKEKKIKADVLGKVFDTGSWKQIEVMNLQDLRFGTGIIKDFRGYAAEYIKCEAAEGRDWQFEEIMLRLDNIIEQYNSGKITQDDIFGEKNKIK